MRVVIDACVLYPTVMREMLLGAGDAGLFTPAWSDRLLEEWARAAARLGPDQARQARVEIALLRVRWPGACLVPAPEIEAALNLPDENDRHVLAVAINGGAEVLLTLNRKDFPTRTLGSYGILRRDPDGFLRDFFEEKPEAMRAIAARVQSEAVRLSGCPQPLRALLKKARLPRLAKALGG